MENTKKIIGFFTLLFFIAGCDAKNTLESIKNPNLIEKNSSGYFVVKIPFSRRKPRRFHYWQKVRTTDKKIENIDKVIDFSSFDYLDNFKEDKIKIDTNYYTLKPMNNYFKDKNHIYIYQHIHIDTPVFFVAGSIEDYEMLGGGYLRVGRTIYWEGKKIDNVDIDDFTTFKTLMLEGVSKGRVWEVFVGKDSKYLYGGSNIMNYEAAKNYYDFDENIMKQYFNKL